jgi:hypothetical protein
VRQSTTPPLNLSLRFFAASGVQKLPLLFLALSFCALRCFITAEHHTIAPGQRYSRCLAGPFSLLRLLISEKKSLFKIIIPLTNAESDGVLWFRVLSSMGAFLSTADELNWVGVEVRQAYSIVLGGRLGGLTIDFSVSSESLVVSCTHIVSCGVSFSAMFSKQRASLFGTLYQYPGFLFIPSPL